MGDVVANVNTGEESQDVSNAKVVKCKSCGADMYYDIASGKLKCQYCGSTQDVNADVYLNEHSLDNFDESKYSHDEGAITYQCPNCHAKTVMHAFTSSMKCPFCGATNILKVEDMPGLKPDAILPFKVTKELASQNALKWIRKRLYAPRKLKKSFRPEKLSSIYSSCYTFDSNTYSSYSGVLGKNYYETVGTGKEKRTVVKVRYFSVSGSFNQNFDDVLIEASHIFNQRDFEKVGAFDTANSLEYTEEYIAGHASERYDTTVNDAYQTAKEKMSSRIRAGILAQYDYDVVQSLDVRTKFLDSTFKYILVPLWCSSFKYRDKLYNYFINGRTGKVGGKTPVSVFKVIVTVLVLAAIAVGLYYAIMF